MSDLPSIVLRASELATRLAAEMGVSFDGFTPTAEGALEMHRWNAGEVTDDLKIRLTRALAMTGGGRLSSSDLFPELVL